MSCLFCDIIHKQAHAYRIYENEIVCCFLDLYPINFGHVLVVPKKHYREFTELDQMTITEIMMTAQKVAKILEKLLSPDGLTLMQNNGIFNDIGHYHLHLIPRFKNDGFGWVEPDIKVDETYFLTLMNQLKDYMNEYN